MDISTRLLAISAELIMMPADIDEKKCRAIFDRISDSHQMGSYLLMPDGGVQMASKKQKPNFTRYIIMKDRLVMAYEFCENSMEYFSKLMSDFLAAFSDAAGPRIFPVQGITIRKAVNMKGIADSRDFLIKKAFSIKEENLQKFGRPLHVFGASILFPPVPADQSTFEVKIGTMVEDYKTFLIENKAMFPQALDSARSQDLAPVIAKTDAFIDKNLVDFITQFA